MSPLDVFWSRCEGPIIFGVNDCCMTLADVIAAAGGPDLMARYRGRYTTARGFVRAYRKAGHTTVTEAALASMASSGRQVTEGARDFDVAVVPHRDRIHGVGSSPAFFHDDRWMFRSEQGLAALHASPAQIYRVI